MSSLAYHTSTFRPSDLELKVTRNHNGIRASYLTYGCAELTWLNTADLTFYRENLKLHIPSPALFFNRLKVQEKFQNRGLGTLLLNAVLAEVDQQLASVVLQARPYTDAIDPHRLIQFYQRAGFSLHSRHGDSTLLLRGPCLFLASRGERP